MGPESSNTEGSQEANDIPDRLRRERRCQTAPAPSLKQAQENAKSAVATSISDDTMERSKQGSRKATAALSQARGAEVRRQQQNSETGGRAVGQAGRASRTSAGKQGGTDTRRSVQHACKRRKQWNMRPCQHQRPRQRNFSHSLGRLPKIIEDTAVFVPTTAGKVRAALQAALAIADRNPPRAPSTTTFPPSFLVPLPSVPHEHDHPLAHP